MWPSGWEVRRCGPLGSGIPPGRLFFPMYLLYLDDSVWLATQLTAISFWLGSRFLSEVRIGFPRELDAIAQRVWHQDPHGLEFRGADIFGGKKQWRGIQKTPRINVYREALAEVGNSRLAHLFGAVIHKAAISPNDPMEFAFEHVCNRFDRFLGRLHRQANTQRGMILLDDSTYETSLQGLARNFRTIGHRWGQLYNLADVPFFASSKATRMLQYADMVAYALRRYYENGDAAYFDLIANRFDAEGGVIHGLVHYTPGGSGCNCASCRQRRAH